MTLVNGHPAASDHGPGSTADTYGYHLLGLRTLEGRPGYAVVAIDVTESHLNDVGIAHGGAIFSLADQAVALAANLHGETAVVTTSTIHLVKQVRPGERIVATAREDRRGRTLSLYTVRVTRGEDLVALVTSQTTTVGTKPRPGWTPVQPPA